MSEYIAVNIDDKLVYVWFDEANLHYPEDLTWGRIIGGVFKKAYELGQKNPDKEFTVEYTDDWPGEAE